MSGKAKKGAAAFGMGLMAAGGTAAATVVAGLALLGAGWYFLATPAPTEPELRFADPGGEVQVQAQTDTGGADASAEADAPSPRTSERSRRKRVAPTPTPARSRSRTESPAPAPAPSSAPRSSRAEAPEPSDEPAAPRPPAAAPEASRAEADEVRTPSPMGDDDDDEPVVADADSVEGPPDAPAPGSSMRPDRPPPVQPAPAPVAPQPLATKPVEEGEWSLKVLVNQGIALLTGDPVPANAPEGMPPAARTKVQVQQPPPVPAPAARDDGWADADGAHAPAPAPEAQPPGSPAPAMAPAPSPAPAPTKAPEAGAESAPEPTVQTEPEPEPATEPPPAPAPTAPPAPAPPPRPMGTLEALVAGGMGMMQGQAMEDRAPARTRTRTKVDEATVDYTDPTDGGELLTLDEEQETIDLKEVDPADAFASTEPEDDGWDEGPSPLDDLTVTVRIQTSTPGVSVSIDGRSVGVTPLELQLSDDEHTVALGPGGRGGSFEISPLGDPDTWCFEASGATYKQALCK